MLTILNVVFDSYNHNRTRRMGYGAPDSDSKPPETNNEHFPSLRFFTSSPSITGKPGSINMNDGHPAKEEAGPQFLRLAFSAKELNEAWTNSPAPCSYRQDRQD
ncbi:hypothetical protein ABW19_dt0203569 [Dactylella cylindrospora]|nr:hypothetical protein ABW19_dt0203569 [Dactylella cylindrospora]